MTEYLTDYMNTVSERLDSCGSAKELEKILSEHMDKTAFMQHERIVHFLVTMLFAIVLSIFMVGMLMTDNIMLLILVTIIIVLLAFYIKHYYFLENTVQKMYKVYDRILKMQEDLNND
ncbi:MAG: hypothetical protein K2J40_00450 [Ruminococcus sp.]|nr:hypothetical protein [Ruminococcus sp.]